MRAQSFFFWGGGGWGGGGNVMFNHDADSEACLNWQIKNKYVKRKAMEDLYERPRKLIYKELKSQDLDTLTYEDMRNISRNMHKACSSQLLPLPINIEETHEDGCINIWNMLSSKLT